jgi:dihydropteroate synthase
MHTFADYGDAPDEVAHELGDAMSRALAGGVARDAIILDPGLGFAKRAEHSYAVLARLDAIAKLDRPILSGPSRKSFLKTALGERLPADREWGTAAAVAASVLLGAHIVRVHNVAAMVDVVRVADAILGS